MSGETVTSMIIQYIKKCNQLKQNKDGNKDTSNKE